MESKEGQRRFSRIINSSGKPRKSRIILPYVGEPKESSTRPIPNLDEVIKPGLSSDAQARLKQVESPQPLTDRYQDPFRKVGIQEVEPRGDA